MSGSPLFCWGLLRVVVIGFVAAGLLSAVGGCVGAEPAASDSSLPLQYSVRVKGQQGGGETTVLVNGFEQGTLAEIGFFEGRVRFAPQVLAGENNEVALQFRPGFVHAPGTTKPAFNELHGAAYLEVERQSMLSRQAPMEISGPIPLDAVFQRWKQRALEHFQSTNWAERERAQIRRLRAAGEPITQRDLIARDSMKAWIDRHPMTVTQRFDNDYGPSYPAIDDTTRLLDFALRLRDLVREEDEEALDEMFAPLRRPSFDDSTRQPPLTDMLTSELFPANLVLGFDRADVGLEPAARGRMWELYIKPRRPFFRYLNPSERTDGRRLAVRIWAGEIDGALRVVQARRDSMGTPGTARADE